MSQTARQPSPTARSARGGVSTPPSIGTAERLAASARARLRVVPHRRVRAPRVPFVTLVSLVLVGGVVGLLCFNTQMQQASFTAATLQERADNLGARQQTLEMEVDRLDGPNHVMAAAQRIGLVGPPTSPAQLWLTDGRVTGTPSAADAANAPPLQGRAPVKPAAIAPAPQITTVPAPEDAAAAAAAADAAAAAAAAAAAVPPAAPAG